MVKITLTEQNVKCSPMELVGKFLHTLLHDHTLPSMSFARRNSFSLPHHQQHSITTYHAQPLYSCPTYSQRNFQYLILSIFTDIPEAYQVLRCQATTTEEELNLFLKRTEKCYTHYLLLDVNKLPSKLQEVLFLKSQRCLPISYYAHTYSILLKLTWLCREVIPIRQIRIYQLFTLYKVLHLFWGRCRGYS